MTDNTTDPRRRVLQSRGPGQNIDSYRSPTLAQIVCDGVQGVMVTPHMTKLELFHIVGSAGTDTDGEEIEVREIGYVLNIPTLQFIEVCTTYLQNMQANRQEMNAERIADAKSLLALLEPKDK